MLCLNCQKLNLVLSNKKCVRCNNVINNQLSHICNNCSDTEKICAICLKKIINTNITKNFKFNGCNSCGKK